MQDLRENISKEVSPDDDMYLSGPDWYFTAGESALENILSALGEKKPHVHSILDIGCGFGRVLRYLRAYWPEANIVACDLNVQAVDFCARVFSAEPVYSSTDFKRVGLDRKFDLIWCGSLLTHLSEIAWNDFFALVLPKLQEAGTFAFTTHGRVAAHLVALRDPVFGLTESQCRKLLTSYRQEGFGYVNYDDKYPAYGLSLSSPAWIMSRLQKIPNAEILFFREHSWGHQDVFALTKSQPLILDASCNKYIPKCKLLTEKAFRLGTKSRRYFVLLLTAIRIIRKEGWRAFWRRARSYCTRQSRSGRLKVKPLKIKPLDSKKPTTVINKKVSIVIPTKNAGTYFTFTLEGIRNQIGIREIELIIVDSGSTDDTIKLAKDHDALVYTVKPSEFNHGLTRNYGADQSSGDYVLFMVQDAIPSSDHWLFDMANVLESNKEIAAVTCRQFLRNDADLFVRYLSWTYYRALEFSLDEVRMTDSKFDDLSPTEKRRLCGLEDVCCLIRKDVFDKFKFKNIQYAEDLELGVRLQRNGYKMAFLYSVGVVHSHNRSASYYFKRGYVDSKSLPEILAYDPVYQYCNIHSVNDLINGIMTLYAALNMSVPSLQSFDESACNVVSRLRALLQNNVKNTMVLRNYERMGNYLDELFDELRKIGDTTGNPESNDLINESYFAALNDFSLYLEQNNTVKNKNNEFIDALYKIFALVAGYAIANYYLFKSKRGERNEALSAVDRVLSTGV